MKHILEKEYVGITTEGYYDTYYYNLSCSCGFKEINILKGNIGPLSREHKKLATQQFLERLGLVFEGFDD